MMSETNLVPLGLLALEGHGDGNVDTLARLLVAEVVVDQATGLRSVHAVTARRLHDERADAKRAAAQRRQLAARQPNPTVERVKAIAAQQDMLRDAGVIGPDTPAIGVVARAEHQAKMERRGRIWDRLKRATPENAGFGATFAVRYED